MCMCIDVSIPYAVSCSYDAVCGGDGDGILRCGSDETQLGINDNLIDRCHCFALCHLLLLLLLAAGRGFAEYPLSVCECLQRSVLVDFLMVAFWFLWIISVVCNSICF